MENRKQIFQKIAILVTLALSGWGFWYFEETYLLRIVVISLGLIAVYFTVFNKKPTTELTSRHEITVLLALYLGTLTLYNLLFGLNIPLYVIMVAILCLVSVLFYCFFGLEGLDVLLGKNIFYSFIVLMGIVVLEVFLSLYFWPVAPEAKSLILVVIFYLITSHIYLYIHSMLRLKRILGYLLVSLIILGAVLLVIWMGLPK